FGGSHQPSRYYFPLSCRDTFTGMNVVYGISCDAFVAKAKGVALVPDVGGWHYAPAGISRAIIDRQNIARIPNIGAVDREAFVLARINPVSVAADGSVYIDDSLTTYSKNNYLRFQHVSSLMNAIARNFYDVAQAIKHEPDGITKETLMKAMTELLDRYVAAGALVTPRDKSQGEDPYVVQVVQKDIDLWEVSWSVCPTGTARRIVGKPILMR
ncbi:phage tail protein, partial [Escherichia coli]